MIPKPFARYELKYYVGSNDITAARTMLAPFVRPDPFAERRPGYEYTVRSIYFDTPQLRFYHEKDAGLKNRKKLRLRTYNHRDRASIASFEIKRKYGRVIFKERVCLPLERGLSLLAEGRSGLRILALTPGSRARLERFLFLMEALRLRPSVLVTYEREAYVGRSNLRSRVTIDKHVRSILQPRVEELHDKGGFRHLTNHKQILELKFDGAMPPWMRPVTAYLDRSHRPISKYCKGIDLWQTEPL
ncbi:MAG: polyphosphate polymerase domain-containing protein [Candidatus Eisenbacteria sp.]|nr:polyphosphate polymerase domain-containing protein [Candidatus Eisenbacteria bacterium]